MMRKVIVEIFFLNKNYSAHIPELPGCISTGKTIDEIKANIAEAIEFHLEGIKDDGEEAPLSFRGEYMLLYKFL
jgi:predicted RNase H-like HicB family nuclease